MNRTEFEENRVAGLRLRHEQRLARAEVRVAVKLAQALGRAEAAEEIADAVRAHSDTITVDIVLAIAAEVGARVDDE